MGARMVDDTVHKYGMAGLEAVIAAKDARIKELETLLWQCRFEINAINARDGAPIGVSQEYWDSLLELTAETFGGDPKPWPPHKGHFRELQAQLQAEKEQLRGEIDGWRKGKPSPIETGEDPE